ncbi:DUF3829 domain-containing protein [Candidatus Pantoea multigeneris]|uniref:DUF3829 domain-containing protein n=1 Tax=Candidatus Pantoea multigeneris TaxID=2608357 RepID=A0ABX0RKG2_9GAMM|nr:DUF3829 domain-containing protein [Pantoea multigeneris]NIF23815.1 DUF3829 domain-containing protein [Pantoea multigeneris]
MFVKKNIYLGLLLASVMGLSACDNAQTSSETPQLTAQQAEIQKYNTYIKVANFNHDSFEEYINYFQHDIKPEFVKPTNNIIINSNVDDMRKIKKYLDDARSMKPAMPDLDGPAQEYSNALAKSLPIGMDMHNYIAAKTYLSDNGAHGREVQDAVIASLQQLAHAEQVFLKSIDVRDRAQTKAAFENSEKGTQAYYKAGMVYYMKQGMDAASDLQPEQGLGKDRDAFNDALNQFASMAKGYESKIKNPDNSDCSILRDNINSYLSIGRTIISRTDSNYYYKKKHSFLGFAGGDGDPGDLEHNFNGLISSLNASAC